MPLAPDAPRPDLDRALSRTGWSDTHLAERFAVHRRTVDRWKLDPPRGLLAYLETVARVQEAVPMPPVRKRAPRENSC